MRVVTATSVPPKAPQDYGAAGVTMREIFTAAMGAPTFSMRHFEVASGGQTLHHFHPWEHEVYILDGVGELLGEDGAHPFAAGDCCYTAPNELHQFRNTGALPLRFLCIIPNLPSAAAMEAPVRAVDSATEGATSCDVSDWRMAEAAASARA